MHGMGMDPSMFGGSETLVLNANNALVQYIFEHKDSEHVPTFCKQLYDLAMIANQPLPADEMAAFIARSNEIIDRKSTRLNSSHPLSSRMPSSA